jgi:hypothetical protein
MHSVYEWGAHKDILTFGTESEKNRGNLHY